MQQQRLVLLLQIDSPISTMLNDFGQRVEMIWLRSKEGWFRIKVSSKYYSKHRLRTRNHQSMLWIRRSSIRFHEIKPIPNNCNLYSFQQNQIVKRWYFQLIHLQSGASRMTHWTFWILKSSNSHSSILTSHLSLKKKLTNLNIKITYSKTGSIN